jgi:uncharacterized membrane protein
MSIKQTPRAFVLANLPVAALTIIAQSDRRRHRSGNSPVRDPVRCIRAESRTPAVAAAYLIRSQGMEADAAIDRVETLTRSRPQPFLMAGLRTLAAP